MKKIVSVLLFLLILVSCKSFVVTDESYDSSKDIVILYTNMYLENQDQFYLNVLDTKESLLQETPNVTLVDTGNNLSISLMNGAGYNYACLGLNDFSYGLESIYNLTKTSNCKYLLCSASYNGKTKDVFKNTSPYEVVDYDGIKVGYIGVLSPRYVDTVPSYFSENDSVVVNVYNETEEVFYDTVQCSIDKAKEQGANYIVLLSNFDDDSMYSPYTLEELISNLSFVDIVINGNDYSNLGYILYKNKDNKDVTVVSNGPNGTHFGKIVINSSGIINTSLD